jgi:hypothetical protein
LSGSSDADDKADTLNNKAGKATCTTRIILMLSIYTVRSAGQTIIFLLPHPTI